MYEGSHECTKCSNPASVHLGCVYMTTNIWQGIKSCLVSWAIVCPSPFGVGPRSSFLFMFGLEGSPHLQQSSTNLWDLLSGERIRCLNGKSHWPAHTTARPLGFLQRWPRFPPHPTPAPCNVGFLSSCSGVSRPLMRSRTLPGCVGKSAEWRWGPRAVHTIWKYLPRVDPALMFFWHPSESRPCTKWISELILWGDKITRIVLPKIMKYRIMSAFYHWFECVLRKLNVTKTQDIFGNCMLSSKLCVNFYTSTVLWVI